MMMYLAHKDGQVRFCSPSPIPQESLPDGWGVAKYRGAETDMGKLRVVNGKVKPKTEPQKQRDGIATAWLDLRMRRAALLAASDWTQVPDAPVDQAAWRAYRQSLRDLPANTSDPSNPDWPEAPE